MRDDERNIGARQDIRDDLLARMGQIKDQTAPHHLIDHLTAEIGQACVAFAVQRSAQFVVKEML